MENDVEAFSIAAEEKNDISLLTKANSFSITIRSKRETLASLDNVFFLFFFGFLKVGTGLIIVIDFSISIVIVLTPHSICVYFTRT